MLLAVGTIYIFGVISVFHAKLEIEVLLVLWTVEFDRVKLDFG